jgi:hypothetical protein
MTQIIKLVNNIIFINKKIFKKIRKYFFIIVTNITNLFNKLFHTYKYNNDDLSKSFAFTILFNWFGVQIPDSSEPILGIAFGVFSLCFIALFSFINILGYFFSIYLINKYDINNKLSSYPWIIKIINYFEKSSIVFIVVEVLFVIFSLVFLIGLSLYILGVIIF